LPVPVVLQTQDDFLEGGFLTHGGIPKCRGGAILTAARRWLFAMRRWADATVMRPPFASENAGARPASIGGKAARLQRGCLVSRR
jgi:hypothetical protein